MKCVNIPGVPLLSSRSPTKCKKTYSIIQQCYKLAAYLRKYSIKIGLLLNYIQKYA